MPPTLSRRHWLAGAGAASLAATARLPMAHGAQTGESPGPVLIRGAYVMTMGPEGDLSGTDVLVEDGRIAAIGEGLDRPGATVLDATGQILLPGFVDTHTHIWLSQMRGLFGRSEASQYFPLVERLGAAFTPEDMRIGTLFGAAGTLSSGITTTFPYCDNIRGPAFAEAALQGLAESGIRARFLYTGHDGLAGTAPLDWDHIRRLHQNWSDWSAGGLIELGLGWRSARGPAEPAVVRRAAEELERARTLGLPVSTHVSGAAGEAQLDRVIEAGQLGPDLLLVHATGARPDQLDAVRAARTAIVLTPITEHRVGFGVTTYQDYEAAAPGLTLGLDGGLGGSPDMFGVMRMLHNISVGAAGNELAVTPRRMLEMATLGGAEAVGLGAEIGSIERGKRADVILVDPRRLSMGPMNDDPSALLVYAGAPEAVRTVMVDGIVRKRDGALTHLSEADLTAAAAQSIAAVRGRAGG